MNLINSNPPPRPKVLRNAGLWLFPHLILPIPRVYITLANTGARQKRSTNDGCHGIKNPFHAIKS